MIRTTRVPPSRGIHRRFLLAIASALLAGLWLASPARAAVHPPEWVASLESIPTPKLPGNPAAVVLYEYSGITVMPDGREESLNRVAYRILRPQAVDRVTVRHLFFDSETKIRHIHAWGVPAQGKAIERKDKDAVEVSPFGFILYSDDRELTIDVPGMHVGDLVAFEWQQQGRPQILQDSWSFQERFPVLDTRLDLQLPQGWEFRTTWVRYAEVRPTVSGNGQWSWELHNVPAVDDEPEMPPVSAVAGWMGLTYLAPGNTAPIATPAGRSWQEVANWAYGLAAPQRKASPAMEAKVRELTSGKTSLLDKIQAVSEFVQHHVRYVAIEIGVGGYQPHPADAIYSNLYGDCKDKATLLNTMLQILGVRSWMVLVNTDRGSVVPGYPSAQVFDHAIVAIQLPDDPSVGGLFAVRDDPALGKILFFDPTSELTSFGSLPFYEQGGDVLITDPAHGELVTLPVLPPPANRLLRVGNFRLLPDGTLAGGVRELRWGRPAIESRASLLAETDAQRTRDLEKFLGAFLSNYQLRGSKVEDDNPNISIDYVFVAPQYASQAGDLLLLRPCVLGEKADGLATEKPRQYPVSFDSTSLQSDIFKIALPPGYTVDGLPRPVDVDDGFAVYRSKVELTGPASAPVLTLTRNWEIKSLSVPVADFSRLNHLYGLIEHNEQQRIVLKPVAQQANATAHP